jgi:uncharacterized membrane protein (UPF0127 family)
MISRRGRSAWALAGGVLLAVLVLAPAGLRAQEDPSNPPAFAERPLQVGKVPITVQIADDEPKREYGLMFRPSLPDNAGMIFELPVGPATFWMKNTEIPLSVAFIDPDGTILEIHDMKAEDTSITRSDSANVAYALEMNLHWFALNGIKPGDRITPAPATWAHPTP